MSRGSGRTLGAYAGSPDRELDGAEAMDKDAGWLKKMIAKLFGPAVPCHDQRLDDALAKFNAEVAKARAAIARVSNDPDALAELADNIRAQATRIKHDP